MKKLNNSIFIIGIISLVFLGTACTEDFQFQFEDQKPLLVVDGKITNQSGPYYVRLTESINEVIPPNYSGTSIEVSKPIINAVVTLSDDVGNSELLKYIGHKEGVYPEEEGWYIAETIEGVSGRTYTLSIVWEGQTYIATDKMEKVPPIEKVSFRTKHLESKNEDVSIPLIFFNEPQGIRNYYLLYYSVNGYIGSNRKWAFSIINDKYLEAYVNGLEMDDGQSPSGRDFYSNIDEGASVMVNLESLSEPAYQFYEGLIDQFDSDGGAFSSAPASPPSNISGGALGYFRASAVSVKEVIK